MNSAVANPEMVRNTPFLVAPFWIGAAGGQKWWSWHFRTLFFDSFFGGAKKE
jgi:hypothetical protein